MGRALFSKSHPVAAPAVRSEPEPVFDPPYERWSRWNFDPDSDEFFNDAEYEAFVDPASAFPPDPAATTPVVPAPGDQPNPTQGLVRALSPISSGSSDSESTSTASDSGRASPQLGADTLDLTRALADLSNFRRESANDAAEPSPEEARRRAVDNEHAIATLVNRVASMLAASNPEASARLVNAAAAVTALSNATTEPLLAALGNTRGSGAQRQRSASASVMHPRTPAPSNPATNNSRRVVNIVPTDIPSDSPLSPTPPSYPRAGDEASLDPPVIPGSASPLTNPNARRSVSHIAAMPTRTPGAVALR